MPGFENFNAPSFPFLVEHSSSRMVLFDLGVRKDYKNFSPLAQEMAKDARITLEKDVSDVLKENGTNLADVEAVIWR
jgi:hypothetical protein